jgi:hypothetical protein
MGIVKVVGPTFKELFPGINEYESGKPTEQFKKYVDAVPCRRSRVYGAIFGVTPERGLFILWLRSRSHRELFV